MNKERLDWVMSGLNQHVLTKAEDQFPKTALEDFDKNHALTAQQEEKIGILYKEKSKLIPNRNSSNYFSFRESSPQRARVPRLRAKDVLIAS